MLKLLTVLGLSFVGCVSLRNRPIANLNIVGNPLIRCSIVDAKVGKVSIEGRFVCRTTTETNVIRPCHVDNPDWVGRMVLEDRGVYWTIWEPENTTCVFIK
jgi:hypothetical protein